MSKRRNIYAKVNVLSRNKELRLVRFVYFYTSSNLDFSSVTRLVQQHKFPGSELKLRSDECSRKVFFLNNSVSAVLKNIVFLNEITNVYTCGKTINFQMNLVGVDNRKCWFLLVQNWSFLGI